MLPVYIPSFPPSLSAALKLNSAKCGTKRGKIASVIISGCTDDVFNRRAWRQMRDYSFKKDTIAALNGGSVCNSRSRLRYGEPVCLEMQSCKKEAALSPVAARASASRDVFDHLRSMLCSHPLRSGFRIQKSLIGSPIHYSFSILQLQTEDTWFIFSVKNI